MAQYSFLFSSVPQPAHDEEGRQTKTFFTKLDNPQRLFLLYIHKLLTDSLDFEAVARDFASKHTSNKLFCYSFHMQIISFMSFSCLSLRTYKM